MKQLELTARLHAVAQLVPKGSRLADIGTDHAYLPVWLLLNGRISAAIAADLREGPLERARATARQYGCYQALSFRLCDGLTGISPGEANTIVVAGMGGETISAILERSAWISDCAVTLILQPMSAQNELRHWLWTHNFALEREELVAEGDKLYNIIVARYGTTSPMSPGEEWAGRQSPDRDQPLRGLFLKRLLEKTDRAICGISRGKEGRDNGRLEELRVLRAQLEEMKQEWDAWHK